MGMTAGVFHWKRGKITWEHKSKVDRTVWNYIKTKHIDPDGKQGEIGYTPLGR